MGPSQSASVCEYCEMDKEAGLASIVAAPFSLHAWIKLQ